MYGEIGKEVGEILSTVCKITGVQLIKGGVCPYHVHLYVSNLPKMRISDMMPKLKGKSTLIIFADVQSTVINIGGISGREDIMQKQRADE